MPFPYYKQLNAMDCGPTCLRMISSHYGKHYRDTTLRNMTGFSKLGVSLLGLSEAAESLGFRTRGVKLSFDQLKIATLPCVLLWDQNHFVVLISISDRKGNGKIKIADPARGIIMIKSAEFLEHWATIQNENIEPSGICMLFEPTPGFYEQPGEKEPKFNASRFLGYLYQSKWEITQIFLALILSALLSLIFPYLTQSIIDTGVSTRNLQYIVIVLLAQLMLTFSRTIVDFIRSRLLLKISNTLTLSILSDFWIKLTRLPVSYFDIRHAGDTMQRIGDQRQIQIFLTGTALNTLFSLLNLFVYSIVLVRYSTQLFFLFLLGSVLYCGWIKAWLPARRKLNYQSFHLSAKENNATLQLVQGMHEIRLNNAEQQKRWNWENIQVLISKLNFKNLGYSQWQQAGALFISQTKDLLISFLVAKMVIEGKLTLGAMLSVQYIIGQLSNPIEQLITFMQGAQDARISMERLNEIHQLPDEEPPDQVFSTRLPDDKQISINHLSFTYPGAGTNAVFENISLHIPEGKVTAIVGTSGSGKTTLLKILLKFYDHYQGEITIGGINFKDISPSFWRSQCGAVLQDGYIFNDTIAGNIAVGPESINHRKLIRSCKTANILSYIESLPNGFQTQFGADGIGLSQGQKQRLLIARAIYKDPQYLFFDEATNALDANNEREIARNLKTFFDGRTVVVVAHRLSTVSNADKIIVLEQGRIVEEGSHEELSLLKGHYYQLVKNQLELGN
jgi:ATP-binding cassette subfamily B protein